MTPIEDRLRQLMDQAAPDSEGVDPAEVSRRGRRRHRRRVATATGALAVCAAAASLAVVATSGGSGNATVSPLPTSEYGVTATLTPAAASVTVDDLHRDAAVLTRRLAAAGIDGRAQVGPNSITLQVPASAAGSVGYLAGAGKVSFRVPGVVKPAATSTTTAAGGCLSAAGAATGSPPPCITARLAGSCPRPGTAEGLEVANASADDWIVACDTTGTIEYALAPQRLGADAVRDATASLLTAAGGVTGQWIVTVRFTPSGLSTWADLTEAISSTPGCPAGSAANCSLAIVVDGVVQSAPVIQQRIVGPAEISGMFTEQSAKALAAALSSGPLPVPLTVAGS